MKENCQIRRLRYTYVSSNNFLFAAILYNTGEKYALTVRRWKISLFSPFYYNLHPYLDRIPPCYDIRRNRAFGFLFLFYKFFLTSLSSPADNSSFHFFFFGFGSLMRPNARILATAQLINDKTFYTLINFFLPPSSCTWLLMGMLQLFMYLRIIL